jgi:alpha-tubulin suppressor-like RCC1 family protein
MGIHCLDSVKLRTEFAAIGSENLKGGFFEDGGIIQIAAGEAHCGALDKHGQAFLWGRNEYGECGEKPEITKIVTSPRQVKAKV